MELNFKNSEIGTFPSDWEVENLAKLGEFKNGINKGAVDFGFGYPFVNLMDVFGNAVLESPDNFALVNSTVSERSKYDLIAGDILFIRSSVKPSGVGKTSFVSRNLINTVFSGFLIRFRVHNLSPAFKRHCFDSEYFRKCLLETSTISANTNINQEALKKLWLAFPVDFKEQEAIGHVLDDIDALIEQIQKTIKKKEAIKIGAIQLLLSPKSDWNSTTLGVIANIVGGGTPRTGVKGYWSGDINWFTPTEVGDSKYLNASNRMISTAGLENSSAVILPPGTILLTTRASIGDLGILTKSSATNQGFQSLIVNENHSNEFIYYLMSTQRSVLLQYSSGSTFLEISPKKVKEIEVKVPNIDEQRRIASILSDMDFELDALGNKLEKAKNIKIGLTQQLLTGKMRLAFDKIIG